MNKTLNTQKNVVRVAALFCPMLVCPMLVFPMLVLGPAAQGQGTTQGAKGGGAQAGNTASKNEQPTVPEEDWFPKGPLGVKWVSIGVRVPFFIGAGFPGQTTGTANINTTGQYTTTDKTGKSGVGLVLEFPVYKHFTLVAEGTWHHAGFTQNKELDTTIFTGNVSQKWTDVTKLTEYDFPLMLRYNRIRSEGIFSRVYVNGGGAFRVARNVTSAHTFSYTSPTVTTNTSDSIPDTPDKQQVVGAVAGVGYKFLDDFKIRITPEFRYTYWLGQAFNSNSTQSNKRQMEVSIALTF